MSNIKGFVFLTSQPQSSIFQCDDSKNSIEFLNDKISVSGSGIIETFCFDVSKNGGWSWVVCGIGITESRFITKNEWNQIIQQDNICLDKLDGHWIILRWKNNSVEFYNDPLELRKLYWKKENDKILFATQLADMVDISKHSDFSFENYAGYSRFQHSLGSGAFLKDVKRLGTNGCLRILNDEIIHKDTQWDIKQSEDFSIEKLKSIVNMNMPNHKKPLLSLSGGIDSRTVLALFDKLPDLVNFGNIEDADAQAAKIIADKLKKNLDFYEFKLPQTANEKNNVFDNMKKAILLQSSFAHSNIFDLLEEKNKEGYWIIDGGLGEYIRFGCWRRLLSYNVKKHWKQNNFNSLAKYMYKTQYSIFTKRLQEDMNVWALQEFISVMEKTPKNFSFEDWISSLHIRHLVRNRPLNGQGIYDNIIPSYMPLIQPSVLRSIQSIPIKKRMNCRINRKIISQFQPILASVPLAWFGSNIPFCLSNNIVFAKLYSIVCNKLKKQKQKYNDKLMLSLKDLVMDRINSSAVKECGWYDIKNISEFAEMFYNKKIENSQFLYNWLEIDFWREKCAKKI
jgi:hypothetical protein